LALHPRVTELVRMEDVPSSLDPNRNVQRPVLRVWDLAATSTSIFDGSTAVYTDFKLTIDGVKAPDAGNLMLTIKPKVVFAPR
jgi:hypothetical protein